MILNIKTETINQYKLIQHVRNNFNPYAKISIKLLNADSILVSDDKGEYCILEMQEDGTISKEFHSGK